MKYLSAYLSLGFCIFLSFAAYAQRKQADSIVTLQEVKVYETKYKSLYKGYNEVAVDSNYLVGYKNNTLADVLMQNNIGYVRSNGLGTLATGSFRGLSAYHNIVLWNGFNIASPMNGNVDYSLIPNLVFDNAKIRLGGSSALHGSGAVGAVTELSQNHSNHKGLHLSANNSMGSFGTLYQSGAANISGQRISNKTSIYARSATNNYEYMYQDRSQTQKNAAYTQQGLLNETNIKIHRSTLTSAYWWQYSHRQIPSSLSTQIDETHRYTLQWVIPQGKFQWALRTALFAENLQFMIPSFNFKTDNKALSSISEAECSYIWKEKHYFNIGLHNTAVWAQATNLPQHPSQVRYAIFAGYRWTPWQKLTVNPRLRKEYVIGNTYDIPWTYSLGVEYNPVLPLSIYINTSYNYRIPTINDMYWRGRGESGNNALLPESSYAGELGLKFKAEKVIIVPATYAMDVNIFVNNVQNWVIWRKDNSGILTPQNILEVQSKGIELKSEIGIHIKKQKINFAAGADYNEVTVLKSANTVEVGKQLIYVPYNKGFVNITWSNKIINLFINNAYVSYRYTDAENEDFQPAYHTANLQANINPIYIKKIAVAPQVQCNNIFNTRYEVLENNPMPGINFLAGLSVSFYQPINKLNQKL
ncbi:MAG: TonB-dependent receptor [Cytophagales bacterium]|nr:TonB-dependent receptor [Cytophagales bacterium]